MVNEFKLEEIKRDGFLHSKIYNSLYESKKKLFMVNFGFADLKKGGAIIDCTINISDWLDFEVLHDKEYKIINRFKGNDIPELDSIIDFTYDGNILILEDLCGIDEVYHFKFINPKIQITGEYEPD